MRAVAMPIVLLSSLLARPAIAPLQVSNNSPTARFLSAPPDVRERRGSRGMDGEGDLGGDGVTIYLTAAIALTFAGRLSRRRDGRKVHIGA